MTWTSFFASSMSFSVSNQQGMTAKNSKLDLTSAVNKNRQTSTSASHLHPTARSLLLLDYLPLTAPRCGIVRNPDLFYSFHCVSGLMGVFSVSDTAVTALLLKEVYLLDSASDPRGKLDTRDMIYLRS